jgi:hypothetical protein
MAERYLVTSSGLLAREFEDAAPDGGVFNSGSGGIWSMTSGY